MQLCKNVCKTLNYSISKNKLTVNKNNYNSKKNLIKSEIM